MRELLRSRRGVPRRDRDLWTVALPERLSPNETEVEEQPPFLLDVYPLTLCSLPYLAKSLKYSGCRSRCLGSPVDLRQQATGLCLCISFHHEHLVQNRDFARQTYTQKRFGHRRGDQGSMERFAVKNHSKRQNHIWILIPGDRLNGDGDLK